MAKGFSQAEGEALNAVVRGIVERAVASLQVIGMTHEDALSLLVIQAVIRMQDTTGIRRWLRSLESTEDEGRGDTFE
jgi:hypothetical protein